MAEENQDLLQLIDQLDNDHRAEVKAFATYLLTIQNDPARLRRRFFICPVCFEVSEQQVECHQHLMVPCNAENPEDCKPVMDDEGTFVSPAPRWFLDAVSEKADSNTRK